MTGVQLRGRASARHAEGHWFKSINSHQTQCSHSLMARISPSQGEDRSSILRGSTKFKLCQFSGQNYALSRRRQGFDSPTEYQTLWKRPCQPLANVSEGHPLSNKNRHDRHQRASALFMESQLVRVLDLFAKQWVSLMAWGSSPRLSAKQNGLWCNGSTTDSDSVSRGSNPCRPAKHCGHKAEWLSNTLIRCPSWVRFPL